MTNARCKRKSKTQNLARKKNFCLDGGTEDCHDDNKSTKSGFKSGNASKQASNFTLGNKSNRNGKSGRSGDVSGNGSDNTSDNNMSDSDNGGNGSKSDKKCGNINCGCKCIKVPDCRNCCCTFNLTDTALTYCVLKQLFRDLLKETMREQAREKYSVLDGGVSLKGTGLPNDMDGNPSSASAGNG